MAPRASDIASSAGITQTFVQPKAPKVDKKADEARRVTFGNEEEEGDKGPSAGGPSGGGKAGGAGAAQFGQEDRQKVKRKRVKLSELQGKKTGETKAKAETAQTASAEPRSQRTSPEEVGRKVAAQRLFEQGRLAETRHLYQRSMSQAQQDPNNALSPQASQRRMLNSLIEYQKNNYMQHTGDKAGEIYNRPATRQILQALQGLKGGQANGESKSTTSTSSTASNISPGVFKSKSESANKMLEVFMMADRQPPQGYEPYEHVA